MIKSVARAYQEQLYPCFIAAAQRVPTGTKLAVALHWIIRNDGRVVQTEVKATGTEAAELSTCVRERFAFWRYPRFTGEPQHVHQSFTLRGLGPDRWAGPSESAR